MTRASAERGERLLLAPNVRPLTWGEKCIHMARTVFPDLPDDALGFILWEHTGFPCFWEDEPEFSLMRQLIRYRDFGPAELIDIEIEA